MYEENTIEKEIIFMDSVQEKETEWLWYPYIPFGKVTIVQGDPGEGKTTLMLAIAAVMSRGILPQNDGKFEPMNVIYQTAEDGLCDTVKPRLRKVGADCGKIAVIDDTYKQLFINDERLEQAIAYTNAKLVILDPLQAFLGADVDMHRANEIRPVMSRLAALAEYYGCAIVLIGHMNKNCAMKSNYRGLGSIDITAAARSVLIVARDKQNPDIRVIIQVKSSLAPEGKPMAFRLNCDKGFEIIGEYECDTEAILLGIASTSNQKLIDDFLREELADGERRSSEILSRAAELGFSERSVQRARKKCGILTRKKDNAWYWKLPDRSTT